jgi:hypothetical protein
MRLLNRGMALVACQVALLGPAALPAQGPAPVGLQQIAAEHGSPMTTLSVPSVRDTTHVKPNHWKRGARIGFVVAALPVVILGATSGCGGIADPGASCTVVKGAFAVSAGGLGWLVGGMIGSFFPKEVTPPIEGPEAKFSVDNTKSPN